MKRTVLKSLFLSTFFFMVVLSYSQNKIAEVKITTSAQCEMCKEKIEEALAFKKGVKFAELDVETKIVTIKYQTKRTNPAELRKIIASLGYDADDQKADTQAYGKLPNCCKKPEDADHKKHDENGCEDHNH